MATEKDKKIKVKISIPKKFIEPAIELVKDFLGTENIGKVYLPASWNSWGNSQKKAGNIQASKKMEMHPEGDYYVFMVDLPMGVHKFKPAIISAVSDKTGKTKGMSTAIWIACPIEGVGEYICETSDGFFNWIVKVK